MDKLHKTVTVKYGDLSTEIDEKIAPLILEIWKADIHTLCSCQAFPVDGLVMIVFASGYDAHRFLDIVGNNIECGNSAFERVLCLGDNNNWIFLRHPDHETISKLYVIVKFPRSDIPSILDILQEWNKGKYAQCLLTNSII